MSNALIEKLQTFDYIDELHEIANDESEAGRYVSFFSPKKNRPVKLHRVSHYTLKDSETKEVIRLKEPAEYDEDDEPEYDDDDMQKVAEKYGLEAFTLSPEEYIINTVPVDSVVKEGLEPLDKVIYKHQKAEPQEMFISDDLVPSSLKEELLKNVEDLKASKEPDWHPGSNDIVNDIVHPSLYPNVLKKKPEGSEKDFWARKYRSSIYQWLPADFEISKDGKATLKKGGYINNIPEKGFEGLISNIEDLVSLTVKPFEKVWQYTRTAVTSDIGESECDEREALTVAPLITFAGKTIQIVPKIAEYVFKPGTSYEGVWHYEGLSHENIVATAAYFLQVDEELEGGKLEFKRNFTDIETGTLYFGTRQDPLRVMFEVPKLMKPIGTIQTQENRFLLFPNSHAHKLHRITNNTDKTLKRMLVALFFINPEANIQSTTNFKRSRMSFRNAKKIRLTMMSERKADKEDLNGREIEFCEH